MASADASGEKRFTGRHMVILMVAFFGVIIAVNLTMAILASRSWTGLVVDNSYVASQHYNEKLAQAAEQNARGWRSEQDFRNGRFTFSLTDASGDSLAADTVTLAIGRPAFEQQDRTVELQHLGNGAYGSELDLGPGIWSVRLDATVKGQAYRSDSRLLVTQSGEGRFE